MKNELRVSGNQLFMGMEIPVIEGGFGEGKKCVLVKTIAEIHSMEQKKINELINNNLDEFEIGIDLLDLCDEKFKVVSKDLGFITSNGQKYCYLLSEQGYIGLTSLMKSPKAKEVRKNFRREYFNMREIIKSDEQLKAMALLKAIEGTTTEERLNGINVYTTYKVEEAKKPLLQEIGRKEEIIIGLVDEISLAEKRQILNRVVKHNHANYQQRWTLLYREFENKYHINLDSRLNTYNSAHKPKCKNKVDYIEKVMNKIPELYEIAAKLFENDVKDLVDQMYNAISA